ncbi:MAG: histidine kinase dimerization/phosphoacceptor domain -containing protein, partial [Dehalococcoidia bacterium]
LSSLREAIQVKDRATAEYRFRTKKGGYVTLSSISLTEKKDGKAVRLVGILQDITERKQAEEEIKASLKEKELLLKEIHHRVKNNLQVVSSLLYLQSEHIKDEQSLATIAESQNRIKSMALVHEQLYQSEGLARVDFAEYIRNLATYLLRSYGVNPDAITLKIDADDVSLDIDTAIPCGLIINELVSNSLKHAFPAGKARGDRESEIRIGLRAHDNKLTLVVSDNGVGLPGDLDFRNTESLGLHLVNTLTRQVEGTIELDRSGGTAFQITFAEP